MTIAMILREWRRDAGGRMGRVLLAVLLMTAGAMAQTAPALQKRSQGEGTPQQTQASQGFSTLPADASGEYELDDKGSVVQITIERNRLTGYVTKMEQETSLTLYFDKSAMDGSRLSFTTKTVHGLKYVFEGTIVRGDKSSESETGFYRMVGEWTVFHDGAQETERVSLKSTPRLE